MDRFLPSYPSELPAIGERWRDVRPESLIAWENVVKRLLALQMVDQDGMHPRPFFVHLTACGKSAWEQFTQAHADETNAEDFPKHLLGAWSKLKGYAPRLALILHFLRWGTSEVNEEDIDGVDMDGAAALVSYFKAHVRKAYALMDADPRIAEARFVLRWIVKEQKERFSKRDSYQGCKGTFKTVESLDEPFAILLKHGIIRLVQDDIRPGPGRKPSPIFEAHPDLFLPHSQNSFNCNSDSHNSNRHQPDFHSGNCGNSGNHSGENASETTRDLNNDCGNSGNCGNTPREKNTNDGGYGEPIQTPFD